MSDFQAYNHAADAAYATAVEQHHRREAQEAASGLLKAGVIAAAVGACCALVMLLAGSRELDAALPPLVLLFGCCAALPPLVNELLFQSRRARRIMVEVVSSLPAAGLGFVGGIYCLPHAAWAGYVGGQLAQLVWLYARYFGLPIRPLLDRVRRLAEQMREVRKPAQRQAGAQRQAEAPRQGSLGGEG